MLWGVWDKSGQLKQTQVSISDRDNAWPGRFDAASLTLDLAEERFEFKNVGRVTFGLRGAESGWHSLPLPLIINSCAGRLLVSDEALLFVTGLPERSGTSESGFRSMINEPMTRFFCLIRTSELKGRTVKGKKSRYYCLANSEDWMVPTSKFTLLVKKADLAVLAALESMTSEVHDVKALDSSHDLRLPKWPPMGRRMLSVVLPLMMALVGMPLSLAYALSFKPGSTEAVRSVGVGMIFLFGGLISLPISLRLLKRKMKRADKAMRQQLVIRSTQAFIGRTETLANEFARFASRNNITLDFSPLSLIEIPKVEILITRKEMWQPSIYRYAAYLGEIFSREERHRTWTEWQGYADHIAYQFYDTQISVDLIRYVKGRLGGISTQIPLDYYHSTRRMVDFNQAAQPHGLFQALGINPRMFREDPEGLLRFMKSLPQGIESRIIRPFGSFVIRRWDFGDGIGLVLQAYLQPEGDKVIEEARCLRPMCESGRPLDCMIVQMAEMPCGAEALVVVDFGGVPGQPLAFPVLLTDYLLHPASKFGPGSLVRLSVSGIGLKGEFIAPTQGANPDLRGEAAMKIGYVQPANLSAPMDPRLRVSGVVEDSKTITIPQWDARLHCFTLNLQGIKYPVALNVSNARGSPTPGHAFVGEVWFQARCSSDD